MERGREEDEENCRNCPFRGAAGDWSQLGGTGLCLASGLWRLRHADDAEWRVAGWGDLPDPVPGGRLERDAVPLQPRLRDARIRESGRGRRRPGHRRLAAQPWVRAGGIVLLLNRLGYPACAARPDRHAETLRPDLPGTQAD